MLVLAVKGRTEVTLQPLDALTLKDRVIKVIKEAILAGDLQPGARITELKLAGELRIGTTAVREALFELEALGFVARIANKGTFVTQLSPEDAQQIFRVRKELEGLAVELLQERVTEEGLDLLRRHAEGMRCAALASDLDAFYRCDLDFHRTVWRLSENRFLIKSLEQMVVPLFAFFIMRNRRDSRDEMIESVERHFDVLRALSNDIDARKCMEESMQFFWGQAQQLLFNETTGANSTSAPKEVP